MENFRIFLQANLETNLKKGGNSKQKDYNLDLVILLRHKIAFLLIIGFLKSRQFQKMHQKISGKRSRITAWAFSYMVH